MAHAKGYKNDIFISYTRKDDEGIGAMPGWVELFHESLETWLIKRRGFENLTIWRDKEELRGNTTYDSAIENGLEDSALFFAMHSRNFVHSDYCLKELDIFHRSHSARPGGLRIGHNHRVFNILLNNIHYDHWPNQLAGTSGFPMHSARGDELGDFTFPDEPLFMRQLQKIVDAVEQTLGVLQEGDSGQGSPGVTPEPIAGADRSGEAASTAQPPRPALADEDETTRIFVGDAADSLYKRRERLLADIQGEGLAVFADIPPPMEADAHASRVQTVLEQTPFSIHMLDQWPGRRIMDLRSSTYTVEQLKAGLESETPQLIWAPPDLDINAIEDAEYRDFLLDLEQGDRGKRNFEFVRASMVDFAEIVRAKASTLQPEPAGQCPGDSLLLDTHQKDQRFGFKIADILAEKGIEVQFNQESADPVKSLDQFESAIQHAKSLMIMCGQVAPEWMMGRIKKAVRVAAEQFDRDDSNILEDIWVYLLPGAGAPPLLNRIPFRIEILDNSSRQVIDPDVMAPFFAAH